MMCSTARPKRNNSQHMQNISVPEVVLGLYKKTGLEKSLGVDENHHRYLAFPSMSEFE